MSDGFVTAAQCVEGLPVGRGVWELLVCAFLAWLLLGAINESTPFAFSFIYTEWPVTPQSAGLLAAALALGNFTAIAVGGWLADRYGRLAVVRPALVMTLACGVMMQTAGTFFQALAARFILGLVSGSLLAVVPPLVAELLPARDRGFYLTVWCVGWPVGSLYAIVAGCLLMYSLTWRAFCIMLLMPAVILYVCTRAEMLPESPRYLYLAGRREEGYNTLLDMYDKEQVIMPWAPETVSLSCAPARPASSSAGCASCPLVKGASPLAPGTWAAVWLVLVTFATGAAAQSMKLWMPTMLVAQQADIAAAAAAAAATLEGLAAKGLAAGPAGAEAHFRFATGPHAAKILSLAQAPFMLASPNYTVVLVLAQAYIVQALGIICCAFLSTCLSRRRMVQWSLVAAAVFTLAALAAAEAGMLLLCGPLLGLQLASQATALNFLQAFATEYFPTSRRARTVAAANFGAQLGAFVTPVFGGHLVTRISPACAVMFFSSLYILAWLMSLRLPLPSSRERPLHDIDNPAYVKDVEGCVRKSGSSNYRTM